MCLLSQSLPGIVFLNLCKYLWNVVANYCVHEKQYYLKCVCIRNLKYQHVVSTPYQVIYIIDKL